MLGLALVCLAGGCVTMGGPAPDKAKEKPPSGIPCQVVATWQPQVIYSPDPAQMGISRPGLAGRVYLFDEEVGYPLIAEGKIVIDLFDLTAGPVKPVLLEEWRFDKDTSKRLVRKDAIGWGYTLFLPWGTYRPDISMVQLKARFEPDKGTPLYAEASPLTVIHGPLPMVGGPVVSTPPTSPPAPITAPAVQTTAPIAPAASISGFTPRRQ